jgi:precorrin-6Y C5,15-methyltransferase (decarboxylating)
MGKIFVVGVGPGSKEFLTPFCKKVVEDADILIGGRTALSLFQGKMKKVIGDLEETLDFIRRNRHRNIAVLASGDPGFYSILSLIIKNFPREEVEVVPGISSMQLCFSRIKELWHDAKFVSLHGREVENLLGEIGSEKLVILTDRATPPDKVARFLSEKGIKGKAWVCDSLSTASEMVIASSLVEISKREFSGNCVMVLKPDPEVGWRYRSPGIPDGFFEREGTPMTKEEIRAVTISKARIEEDSVIYDIGAGAGSISVEAALLAKKGKVFSIEKNLDRVKIIEKNMKKFGLLNMKVVEGEAPNALLKLPRANRIIIGGSGGKIGEILHACAKKLEEGGIIIINAVTIDTLQASISALEDLGFDYGITQVLISRVENKVMKALNPVSIIDAKKGGRT